MYLLIPLSKQQAICIDMVLKRKKKDNSNAQKFTLR